MVSKIEILQRFYHIYLHQESDFFSFQGDDYYLCKLNNFTNDYYNYINAIGLQGFQVVNNCFNKPISMGYILYRYQQETIELELFLNYSLIPLNKYVDVLKIKESWCIILDEAKCKIGNYASQISHFEHFVVLSYYYQGLGEAAISILNEIKSSKLICGTEHFSMRNNYEILCCPGNLLVASRIKDLASCYQNRLITVEQLESYVCSGTLSSDEIIYLYSRIIFPSEFMKLAINEDCNDKKIKKIILNMYQNIDNQKNDIMDACHMLNKYVQLPIISWL